MPIFLKKSQNILITTYIKKHETDPIKLKLHWFRFVVDLLDNNLQQIEPI